MPIRCCNASLSSTMSSPSWTSCRDAGFKATTFSSGRDIRTRGGARSARRLHHGSFASGCRRRGDPERIGGAGLPRPHPFDVRSWPAGAAFGQPPRRRLSPAHRRLREETLHHEAGFAVAEWQSEQIFAPERADVVDAIRNGQMVVRYQPIVATCPIIRWWQPRHWCVGSIRPKGCCRRRPSFANSIMMAC